jgi:ATP-dependent DNA ligase
VRLLSRRGTPLAGAFGDIAAAARELPPDVLLDGELVIWHDGRLAFDLLQQRMNRTAAAAAREARAHPANFVAFDLLHDGDHDLTPPPYAERRRRLEAFFTRLNLGPPWTLCPATRDRDEAERWIRDWAPAGIEGLVVKDPAQRYRPGRRQWRKYRMRDTTEAVIGAVAGSLTAPTTVLFGRYDETGLLRFVGRSTALDRRMQADLATRLTKAAPDHPWHGPTFTPA